MYAKCGLVDLARAVFDTLNSKNPISWTAMISGYARSGQKAEASDMDCFGYGFNTKRTFCSANLAALELGKELHCLVSKLGFKSEPYIRMAQHGKAKEALSLYNDMISSGVKPNEVTFVGLIYACSHVGLVDKGRILFKSMVECYGLKPSLQHYTCLLDLYSRSGHLDEAENLLNTMPFE
ncbi:pentatricopeptide repeat-containing protein, partial [Tanacetum coccineum]